ncbi:MAG TPA: hypothetical protein VHO24_12295 [Opitutaceae bacterium]|nr:hypothetical protein [Opitutaceae bacterium]
MKPPPFFIRALDDAGFRHAQLADLRYHRKVGIGLAVSTALLSGAATLCGGLQHGKAEDGLPLLGVTLLVLVNHATTTTTIAALEAIDQRAGGEKGSPESPAVLTRAGG